jgi:hypothetical protein
MVGIVLFLGIEQEVDDSGEISSIPVVVVKWNQGIHYKVSGAACRRGSNGSGAGLVAFCLGNSVIDL